MPLLLAHHASEVCASSGCAQQSVMGRTKWPDRYFALGMQLPPGLVTIFFPLGGAVMLESNVGIGLCIFTFAFTSCFDYHNA